MCWETKSELTLLWHLLYWTCNTFNEYLSMWEISALSSEARGVGISIEVEMKGVAVGKGHCVDLFGVVSCSSLFVQVRGKGIGWEWRREQRWGEARGLSWDLRLLVGGCRGMNWPEIVLGWSGRGSHVWGKTQNCWVPGPFRRLQNRRMGRETI